LIKVLYPTALDEDTFPVHIRYLFLVHIRYLFHVHIRYLFPVHIRYLFPVHIRYLFPVHIRYLFLVHIRYLFLKKNSLLIGFLNFPVKIRKEFDRLHTSRNKVDYKMQFCKLLYIIKIYSHTKINIHI